MVDGSTRMMRMAFEVFLSISPMTASYIPFLSFSTGTRVFNSVGHSRRGEKGEKGVDV